MDDAQYHVLLKGRRVGPYDRRTIVGMRIKKAITSADVVVAGNGREMTVSELVRMGRETPFEPSRSGSYSVVQATFPAALAGAEAGALAIPAFKGEVEVRVQTRALRIEGRFRKGTGWKQDRVKVALQDVMHARARGSLVDLALNTGGKALQRLTLELFTPEVAADLVQALQVTAPWPDSLAARSASAKVPGGSLPLAWAAGVGTALVVGGVLVWVLAR